MLCSILGLLSTTEDLHKKYSTGHSAEYAAQWSLDQVSRTEQPPLFYTL